MSDQCTCNDSTCSNCKKNEHYRHRQMSATHPLSIFVYVLVGVVVVGGFAYLFNEASRNDRRGR